MRRPRVDPRSGDLVSNLVGGGRGYRVGAHSAVLYDLTLRVPLFVRAPGRVEPGIDERQVSVIDVHPTVLELAGARVPEWVEGRSLLAPAEAPRPAYSETLYERAAGPAAPGAELASLRFDGWKLIEGPDRVALYDLHADPGELRDVSKEHPEQVERLRGELTALRARFPEDARARPLELAPEDRKDHEERLRSLGYIE